MMWQFHFLTIIILSFVIYHPGRCDDLQSPEGSGIGFEIQSGINQPELLWLTQLSTHAKSYPDVATDAVVDRDGSSYITGFAYGLGTHTDFLTIKVDSSGSIGWVSRYDGPLRWRDEANSVIVDANGNTYVAGFHNGLYGRLEIVTIKINPTGIIEWIRIHPHRGRHFYRIRLAIDYSGNVYVAALKHDDSMFQVTALMYDPEGTEQWHCTIDELAHLAKIIVDSYRNLYLIGRYGLTGSQIVKLDPAGKIVWKEEVPLIDDALIDDQNNLIITGGTSYSNYSGFYIGKLSPAGTILWEDIIDQPLATFGRSLTLDNNGDIIVSSVTVFDLWNITVRKYSAGGQMKWEYTISEIATAISTQIHVNITSSNEIFLGVEDQYTYTLRRISDEGEYLGQTIVPGGGFFTGGFDSRGFYYAAGMFYDEQAQNLDYGVAKFDPQGNHIRTVRYEDNTASWDEAGAMVVDEIGNIYVAGFSEFSDHHALTLWKIDAHGNILFIAPVPDETQAIFGPVAVSLDPQGHVVLVGSRATTQTLNDYIIVKFDSSGNIIWIRHYASKEGAYEEKPTAMAIDAQGNIYITGYGATLSSWPYYYDFLTVKLNPEGDVLWSKRFSGSENGDDKPSHIKIGRDGNIYVGGTSTGSDGRYDLTIVKYDSNGNELWVTTYEDDNFAEEILFGMVLDDSSDIICVGTAEEIQHDALGPTDFLVIKFNTDGELLWTKRHNISRGDRFMDVGLDSDNNIVTVGSSGFPSHFAVKKYNQSGDVLWSNFTDNFPSTHTDDAPFLTFDNADNIYILGYTTVNYVRHIHIVGYSPEGEIRWLSSFGGTFYSDNIPIAIAADRMNNVYVLVTSRSLDWHSAVIHLFKIKPGSTTGIDLPDPLTNNNSLNVHSWPNPFNAATTIAYNLSSPSKVTIRIYNVLGQQVAKPVDEIQQAGMHSVRWSPGAIASGMYLCRVETDSKIEVIRIFVLR